MILMRMADQNGSGTSEVERLRYNIVRAFRRIEWPTGVKNQPLARGVLDLDARSADLVRAAVDCQLNSGHTYPLHVIAKCR
jgi:hypothetical protein